MSVRYLTGRGLDFFMNQILRSELEPNSMWLCETIDSKHMMVCNDFKSRTCMLKT